MNNLMMMTQANVSISDVARLTGLNRATVRQRLLQPEGTASAKAQAVDELMQRMRARWATHFPVRRQRGETDEERIARLRVAFGLD